MVVLPQVLPANPDTAWLGVAQQPRTHNSNSSALEFGSISDALQEAQDGDTIHLLPGTHVTSQVRAWRWWWVEELQQAQLR